ncbi:MAG: glycosyltransferase [Xenococcus sp. MO_188.B8]|nr:glycosyltransferase [Xenococcus sp. MO_188.B8]
MVKSLTVLMSIYNGETYLATAIESILSQTFTNFDFLIVDDASTDKSSIILKKFARQDSRIKIITNKQNQGLAYSLARGVEAATTPWIARMDADDIAIRDRLAKQMKYLEENPDIDILGSYALNINDSGEILGERKVPSDHKNICRLIWTNPLIHPTVIFRRSAILKIGSYYCKTRQRIPEDYQLWFRACAAGLQFTNLPEPLIYYRFSERNFVRNNLEFLLAHVLIGWQGCWLVKASPLAYLGITKPLVLGILPPGLRYLVYNWLKQFDPRTQVS